MAESAVNFLLNQLATWLQEERQLVGGLRDEVRIIHGELEQMRAFLIVADAKEEGDLQIKERVRQVRDIAYETEDVLEGYMLRFAHHGSRGHLKRLYASIKNLRAKRRIASEVKALRSRAQSASNTFRDMYDVLPDSSVVGLVSDSVYDGRGDALLLEDAEVVGIEAPKKELLDWISTADYTLKVVSVVGMAGMGKTTLVKKLYDDATMKENFEHHAWISVSETYTVEKLLRDLIEKLLREVKQAPPSELETMNANGMKEFIYNFLQNKKYVIVLDDVWSSNVWEALKYAFPRTNPHGRGCIITTTRFNNIGDGASCESGGHVYELKPLPPHYATKLFHKKAFLGHSCPKHLEKIGGSILKRCDGLPLAIALIGSVLATKRNEISEWTKLNADLESQAQGHILTKMWKLLSLSYYDLPYYMKTCFLFLSIFPEDHLLEKATILHLWIAEGFVEAKQGKTMEEIAEAYLNELCNRTLIQVVETSRDGRPRNFRIHDLVRAYGILKAKEQGILGVRSHGEIMWDERTRHLALHDGSMSFTDQINNFKYLRTLLFFGSVDSEWISILCKVLQGGCRMLKVLDLRRAPLDTIPDEVFELYNLKYLSLRYTEVALIPKSIGNLGKLETLDLKWSKVTELPVEILKLQRLRYLLVYRYVQVYDGYVSFDHVQCFKAQFEIGQLLCLEKLNYIDVSANSDNINIVKEIGKLKELRRLGIVKLRREYGKELCSSLENLTNLRSLCISSLEECEVIDLQYCLNPTLRLLRLLVLEGCLEKVPQWISSLDTLTELRLRWSKLREGEDPLEHLQGLPSLKFLGLDCAYEGEGLSFNPGGFPRLMDLYLQRMGGLRWVRVEKGSMPCLQRFEISKCEAMVELPTGIQHLPNLNYVRFSDMPKEFVETLYKEKRSRGNEWKLAHVTTIIITNWVNGEWRGMRM